MEGSGGLREVKEGRREECGECRAVDLGFLWVRGGELVAAGVRGSCCEGAGAAGRAPRRAEAGGQQGAAAARRARGIGRGLLRAGRRAPRGRGPSSPSDPTPGAALAGDPA